MGPDRTRPTDVHQHLWPPALIDQLRRRSSPPMLRGWTLHTAGEPPYEIEPADHDVDARSARESADIQVLVSLSSPLGIEALDPAAAAPLLDAWHDGVAQLPDRFCGWASVTQHDPDLAALTERLTGDFVGLQVPATALASPAAVETCGPVLRLCESLDKPVLVHPGPARVADGGPTGADQPPWWAAVVDYPAQLQAAWWAWLVAGRTQFPALRICFVAGAGLAPLQHERFRARSGRRFVVDPDTFVDTSSHGRQAVDALTRALGVDVIVHGSDRPYAEPASLDHLGDAAAHAIRVVNPRRLVNGDQE